MDIGNSVVYPIAYYLMGTVEPWSKSSPVQVGFHPDRPLWQLGLPGFLIPRMTTVWPNLILERGRLR